MKTFKKEQGSEKKYTQEINILAESRQRQTSLRNRVFSILHEILEQNEWIIATVKPAMTINFDFKSTKTTQEYSK